MMRPCSPRTNEEYGLVTFPKCKAFPTLGTREVVIPMVDVLARYRPFEVSVVNAMAGDAGVPATKRTLIPVSFVSRSVPRIVNTMMEWCIGYVQED